MLSIPLQQTGRYLKYYEKNLTNYEREKLSYYFDYDLYKLGNIYDPSRSDAIKGKFLEYPTKKELIDYFSLWFKMGLKHPDVYIDATLENTYGYFYGNHLNYLNEPIGFYGIEQRDYINLGNLDFHNNKLKWGRDFLYDFAEEWSKTPLLSLLYAPAFYTFMLISSCMFLLNKKRFQDLLLSLPLLLILCICIASPVNGHLRYLQPVMVSIPFLISILFYNNKTKKIKSSK